MIIKYFDINKINIFDYKLFLFHGENDELKFEIINKKILKIYNGKKYTYDESEILKNSDSFIESLLTPSLFETKKLIIISKATDKIKDIINDIFPKKNNEIMIILISDILEKNSKLRNYFEKKKEAISIAFYKDNLQTLILLINNYLNDKKISLSQEIKNLIVEKSNFNRKILKTELNKVFCYTSNKKKINTEDLLKLITSTENDNYFELIDCCLLQNFKRTIRIINDTNFTNEKTILILKSLLMRAKRLQKLLKLITKNNHNVDLIINNFKPPIFWKEKEVVIKQLKIWDLENIVKLIYSINKIELNIKKNYDNSVEILLDYLLSITNKKIISNNF